MALHVRGCRLGLLLGLALLLVDGRAWAQDSDPLNRLRALLPADSALAFGDRTDQDGTLILNQVVIDLIWRSSSIRADQLSLTQAAGLDDVSIEMDGVVLRNAGGALAADHVTLDGNAASVLRSWGEVAAPNDIEDEIQEPPDQGLANIEPGELAAKNVTIRATSQSPAQGWFMADLTMSGLTRDSVDRLEVSNLVIYAMGRIQAGHVSLQGLDTGWMASISDVQDIVGGLLPPGGLALMIDDLIVLDQVGQPYFGVDLLSVSLNGQPAPEIDSTSEPVEEDEDGEAAEAMPPVGRLQIDLAAQDFDLPLTTLRPLPIAEMWASVLPETLTGTLRFAGTLDGPAQEVTITTGLIDLADIVYVDAQLSLVDVSFAQDAPRMPLALLQLPGSVPMFSIAGGHLELEDRGIIDGLGNQGIPLPSATIDDLSTRLSNRLPMLAGRLDGVLNWLRQFESSGQAAVAVDPATPAPVVELLSLILINPDGVADRLGLSDQPGD